MTRPVQMPADLEAFAEAEVDAGHYESVDQVHTAAMALLREKQRRREWMDAYIQEGIDSSENERLYTADEVLAAIDEIIAQAERG